MNPDPKVVADLALPFQPKAYLRIMPEAHAATPLGMGFGQTRFAAPDNSFQLIYLARNLATAIAETVVRDRFEGKSRRILDIMEVEDWVVSEVTAKEPLTLVDLRTTGLLKLGVTTNAARAKGQAAGRRLSKALYDRFTVDGVLYSSRLTSAECLAIYDRAVKPKLQSTAAVSLARHAGLIAALTAINVSVRGLA